MRISFTLNGTAIQIEAAANERLLHVLRREFSLFSLKSSCLNGQCGSCTLLMNGQPVPSCLIPVFKAEGSEIITLEYFKNTEDYKIINAGFEQAGIEMCGFCDAGKIFCIFNFKFGHYCFRRKRGRRNTQAVFKLNVQMHKF